MKYEIERKFLLKSNDWEKENSTGVLYKQAYLVTNKNRSVRIRITETSGYITIKGGLQDGTISRLEYEYEIPVQDAKEIFDNLCEEGKIEKTRYKIPYENHIWELDVFHGLNEGLITIEVELENEDEEVILPPWVGQDVSHEQKYSNGSLAKEPFSTWK